MSVLAKIEEIPPEFGSTKKQLFEMYNKACACKHCEHFREALPTECISVIYDPKEKKMYLNNDIMYWCEKYQEIMDLNDHCLQIMSVEDCFQQFEIYSMFSYENIKTMNFSRAADDLKIAIFWLNHALKPRVFRLNLSMEEE